MTSISRGEGVPEVAEDILRRLANAAGSGEENWRDRPTALRAERVLGGGRQGARVFELIAHWGDSRWRYVAKVAPAAKLAAEWKARKAFKDRLNVLCVPVQLATVGVLEAVEGGAGDESGAHAGDEQLEAVVYGHAGQFKADPDEPLLMLEELAAAARDGAPEDVERVVELIGVLGKRMEAVFHAGATRLEHEDSLREVMGTLGTCLVLEVDRVAGDGNLVAGQDPSRAVPHEESDLLRLCLRTDADGGAIPDLVSLGRVALRPREGAFEVDSPRFPNLRVEVRSAEGGPDLGGVAGPVRLTGRVVGRYVEARWATIVGMCPDLRREGVHLVLGGERTFLPFAFLHAMLTAQEEGRPVSQRHGDLNPRNVLASGPDPLLIDFEKMDEEIGPLAADFAWLELGLFREAFAERLGFGEALLLQRMLGLASRLVEGVGQDTRELRSRLVDSACTGILRDAAPGLVPAFRVLWAVRAQALRCWPRSPGPPWWRDYLAHLAISANRMLKWGEDAHTAERMRATAVAAGAATECWLGERPFRRWDPGLLHETAKVLITLFAADGPAGAEVVADVMRELGAGHAVLEERLERRRAEVVRAVATAAAKDLVVASRDRHDEYLALTAYDVAEGPPGHDVQDLLSEGRLVALTGAAYSGVTTALREMRFRLASATAGTQFRGRPPLPRIPLDLAPRTLADLPEGSPLLDADLLRDAWARAGLPEAWRDRVADLVALGAVCLVVDDLHRLDAPGRARVLAHLDGLARDQPRLAVVVGDRRAEPSSSFRTLVLAEPEPEQIRGHLEKALRDRGVADPDLRANTVVDALVLLDREESDADPAPSRGFRSPGLLPLVIDLARGPGIARLHALTASDLLDAYVRRVVRDRGHVPGAGFAFRDKEAALAILARRLTEGRADRLPVDDYRALLDAEEVARPESLVYAVQDDGYVRLDVVPGKGTWVAFTPPMLREYFAARWLAGHWRDDGRGPVGFVADSVWHEPIRLLISQLGGDAEPSASLIANALERDLVLAATFLRAAHPPPAAAVGELFRRASDLLGDHGSRGDASRLRAAATALAVFGGVRARSVLGGVVLATGHPAESRVAALTALEGLARGGGRPARTRALGRLREVANAALADEAPPALRIAALDSLGRTGQHHRAPRAAELVGGAQPWPVSEAAMRALRSLDVDPTAIITERWVEACERRLEDIEREVAAPGATASDLAALTGERRALLTELADGGRYDAVLSHRFRFDLDDHVAALLDGVTGLSAGSGDAELLELHGMFPGRARDVVASLTDASSPTRLLAGAAGVTSLWPAKDAALLDEVEHLAGRLARSRAAELMEPLSALTAALFAVDRPRGIRTALRIGLILEEDDVAARRAWPWALAFGRARGQPSDLGALLGEGDDEVADLAVFGLASDGFLLDASPGPEYRLEGRARERFLSRWPAPSGRPTWRFVIAAANAGATEALPAACDVLDGGAAALDADPYPIASGVYGQIENTDLAGVLAAVGYLGHISARQGAPMDRALTTLHGFPVEGRHRSVALGRLAGLAYLGQWRDVLRGCTGDEPRLRAIAENAVFRWADTGMRHPHEVADWIETHVRGVPPGRESS
ncbi:hypothetical protein [Actinomadura terrae]|uniref:hypothetical protein n=1 Tax=Actinomadura terrae TaxID=604353 RepID=UPI001FA7D35E|nr:hypothetical protein [Actinomadura terrae]